MPESDGFVALTDWKGGVGSGHGYVQVWKVEGLDDLKIERTAEGGWKTVGEKVGMKEVARVDVKDGGGCCANVVWYD
jgi:hypothetical protein